LNDDPYIAEFQRRRAEFQPQWRQVGFIFFPGFILFLLGGQLNIRPLLFPGIALCVIGAVRGAMLIFKYRRCPACGAFQKPRVHYPYRTCEGCGERLSVGAKDST
jgi:hypothetical protein